MLQWRLGLFSNYGLRVNQESEQQYWVSVSFRTPVTTKDLSQTAEVLKSTLISRCNVYVVLSSFLTIMVFPYIAITESIDYIVMV